MKSGFGILFLLLSFVLIHSCKDGYDPYYLKSEVPVVIVDSKTVFQYDHLTCQESYNKQRREFRAFKDDMSQYFILRTGSLPSSSGETLRDCALECTTSDDIMRLSGLSFSVEKIDAPSGRIWLWCPSDRVFIVARFL